MEITLIANPQPGVRILPNNTFEEGAILAFRRGGDEVLFGSLSDKKVPLAWIPVGEFSIDPLAIEPVEMVDEPEPGDEPEPDGPTEEPQEPGVTPFGRTRPELRR